MFFSDSLNFARNFFGFGRARLWEASRADNFISIQNHFQSCRLLFGSWTFDNTKIDYFAFNESQAIGTTNCIENEGWNVLSTSGMSL